MNRTIFKFSAITLVIGLVGYALYGALHAFADGNYFQNASFPTILLVFVGLVLLVTLAANAIKWIRSLVVIGAVAMIASCNYSKANQQVLVSNDCGMNWRVIKAGDAVPVGTTNPCFMKVVIPNFPMQGEARFVSNMAEKVRVVTHIDYDYSITDPLAFIKQAKYLGKANSSADSDDALAPGAFEQAENSVIDKRIKEVAKDLFLNEDIVEMDQNALEDKLQEQCNKILAPLGVSLNFITLTFDLDEQTRQSIDVATAMKIYQSKGIGEVGKAVMVAKAGATKVTVTNEAPKQAEEK